MAPTYTTDVSAWIPAAVGAAAYDTMFTMRYGLAAVAQTVEGLVGTPGSQVTIPTIGVTTPADNLAETVPAVDDKLSGAGITVTIKEAVKSIAWSDRTQIQSNQDINRLAGSRLGMAMLDRIELDLAAALLAGRNTAADTFQAGVTTLATLRALRAKIPAALRRRGVTVFIPASKSVGLLDDATVNNASIWGDTSVMESGQLSRPVYGMSLVEVDDGTFANVVVGANASSPPIVAVANGCLAYAVQRNPAVETERDARARLTRLVGIAYHGEGVVDSRGVALTAVAG